MQNCLYEFCKCNYFHNNSTHFNAFLISASEMLSARIAASAKCCQQILFNSCVCRKQIKSINNNRILQNVFCFIGRFCIRTSSLFWHLKDDPFQDRLLTDAEEIDHSCEG